MTVLTYLASAEFASSQLILDTKEKEVAVHVENVTR